MVRILEYCLEQLPQPLSLQGEISETVRGLLMERTRLCSQMNSVVDFHSHVYHSVRAAATMHTCSNLVENRLLLLNPLAKKSCSDKQNFSLEMPPLV